MLTVTDANFSEVESAPLAIVDFWSPACGYCMQFKPIFEEAAAEMGDRVLFVSANVDEAPQAAAKYGVEGLPTIVFLQNGKEVRRFEGATSKQDFQSEIKAAFGSGVQTGIPSSGGAVKPIITGIALAGVLAGLGWLLFRKS